LFNDDNDSQGSNERKQNADSQCGANFRWLAGACRTVVGHEQEKSNNAELQRKPRYF
jgi:hypothetical protein